jgi:hypothetical protein
MRHQGRLLALGSILALGSCHSPTDAPPPCYSAPPEGSLQSALYRVTGSGQCDSGAVSMTNFPVPDATFGMKIRVRINRAKPNTTYYVERAYENGGDGICQAADGGPVRDDGTAAFRPWPFGGTVTPDPGPGQYVTVKTDANGSGSLDFEYLTPLIPRGTKFDVEMRVVDDISGVAPFNESNPTSELRSGCMTGTSN